MQRVLERAIAAKDDALVDAYLEIYQKKRRDSRGVDPREKAHAALRLGLELGHEMTGRRVIL